MTHRSDSLIIGMSVAAGTVILLLPALMAGRPFIYWDTPTFYGWGHDILAAIRQPWPPLAHFPAHRGLWAANGMRGAWDRITPQQFQLQLTMLGARSKFYAVPFYVLGSAFSLWAPTVIQALLLSWTLWTTTAVILPRKYRPASLAPAHVRLVAFLTIGTTAPFFATFLMPDVFASLGVLAAALLLCFPDRLTRGGRVGCAVMTAFAALVHMSHFVVLIALLAIATAAWYLLSPPVRAWRGGRLVVAALVGAAAVAVASDAGMRAIFGQSVRTAPFLEGGVIADGPGQLFLRETCAKRHWVACRYKDLRVMYPDDIIWPDNSWHHLPLVTDPAERDRFLDEQVPVVLGTLLHHPWAQLRHSLAHAVYQFFDFSFSDSVGASLAGILWLNNNDEPRWVRLTVPNVGPCIASPEACNYEHLMQYLEKFQLVVVAAAFVFLALRLGRWCAAAAAGRLDEERRRLAVLALSVIGAVVANAAICGASSGVYGRFQARVIWLVPMLAAAIELREAEVRTQARSVPPVSQVLLGAEEDGDDAVRRPLP